ncbi:alpha-helical ferredoxin [Lucifera butyrica]|uniref:Glycolate oxidase iron-sulfur subunit n=1 Tax=Lucifera butyrica TaxID=1351585 RepID=A0A498R7A2_9FIRM|nr:(Fe-S)-binding protein [Lucifera butyrica]VBB07374.1 alpha-helical ferredoxin [Lucifera butyrica]
MSNANTKDFLPDVHSIVSQCDRCGTCLPVCPLFGVKDIEASSARGKNNIARALTQGGLEMTPDVLAAVNFCLLCRACVETCPNKIQTDTAMMAVRQHFADRQGVSLKYKAMGNLLKRRSLVKLAAGTLRVLRKTGLHRLIPGGLVPGETTRDQFLTAFAGPASLGAPASPSPVSVSPASKVAYFHGCGMRMMFPEAVKETLTILRSISEPILVDNLCCGLPHLAHGLRADYLAMAKENIRLFETADIIVSDCASCSGTLKHMAGYFAGDPDWKDRAEAFSRKVMDLSEYLIKAGYQPRQRTGVTVTFHEPCHLGRGQGIKSQPRELLKAAAEYVEMPGADTCCGGAGSFYVDYPAVAEAVLEKKRQNIEKTGAQVVATSCPICLVQMNRAAQKSGKFRALHISQIL